MATLDDKLLGEKLHYYCSSSEDEDEKPGRAADKETEECGGTALSTTSKSNKLKFIPESDIREWEGNSTNTGPKGVIRDWQRFKQLETEKRQQQEQERIMLAKKLSATCRSDLSDKKATPREKAKESPAEVDSDEEVLQEYLEQRMKELLQSRNAKRAGMVFAHVFELDSVDSFLDCTENTSQSAMVIILLYEDRAAGCASMKNALQYLAAEYRDVKFCQVKSSILNVSTKFKSIGLPALQAYRNGELIGNYVQLVKEFGEEIYGSDVESFLIEHGVLQDRTLVPAILRSSKQVSNDPDSD